MAILFWHFLGMIFITHEDYRNFLMILMDSTGDKALTYLKRFSETVPDFFLGPRGPRDCIHL